MTGAKIGAIILLSLCALAIIIGLSIDLYDYLKAKRIAREKEREPIDSFDFTLYDNKAYIKQLRRELHDSMKGGGKCGRSQQGNCQR
jgi:hypothetical protein